MIDHLYLADQIHKRNLDAVKALQEARDASRDLGDPTLTQHLGKALDVARLALNRSHAMRALVDPPPDPDPELEAPDPDAPTIRMFPSSFSGSGGEGVES